MIDAREELIAEGLVRTRCRKVVARCRFPSRVPSAFGAGHQSRLQNLQRNGSKSDSGIWLFGYGSRMNTWRPVRGSVISRDVRGL